MSVEIVEKSIQKLRQQTRMPMSHNKNSQRLRRFLWASNSKLVIHCPKSKLKLRCLTFPSFSRYGVWAFGKCEGRMKNGTDPSHKKRTKDCSLVLRLYASFPRLYDTTYLGAIELNTQDDSHHHYHHNHNHNHHNHHNHNHHDHHSHNHNHNHHNHHHNNNHSNRSNHSNHSNRSNDDDDDDDDDNSNNNHNQPRRTINDSKICLQTQKHFLELWDHVKDSNRQRLQVPKPAQWILI